MSRYDDKIKSNLEKIAKLQDEIEKRKAKIINLQTENKQLQAEKDNEFSQTLLKIRLLRLRWRYPVRS